MSDTFYNSATSIRQLISTQTATGSSTTLSFSLIPQTFNHLFVYLTGQQASGTGDCRLAVNGVGTGYDATLFYENDGGGSNTATQDNDSSWAVGPLTNATTTPGLILIEFPFYTNANWTRVMHGRNGYAQQSGSINRLTYGFYSNRSASPISSMIFTSGGGNFVVNTVAYLYGLV